jgi:hypothetical protein
VVGGNSNTAPRNNSVDRSARRALKILWKSTEVFRANPALLFSMLYFYVSGFGILSSWAFYRGFGVNIFDYAEIGDFLLAAFRNPSVVFVLFNTLVTFVVAILFVVVMPLMMRLFVGSFGRRFRWSESYSEHYAFWGTLLFPILAIAVPIVLSVAAVSNNVREQAQDIKHGEAPTVVVQHRSFKGSAGQVRKPGLVLLGATQRAVFFYDVNNEQTLVVPQAQIVSIEVREKGN